MGRAKGRMKKEKGRGKPKSVSSDSDTEREKLTETKSLEENLVISSGVGCFIVDYVMQFIFIMPCLCSMSAILIMCKFKVKIFRNVNTSEFYIDC